ncbi:PREDICTED: protein fem-1 homolog C-like [Amphimedon queenslandica]|uniref:Uncharacterized protein n=1 Tax=Amphimedon queenslandica TaxID=400682 RepID=A0A1X7VE41_AMPQE|nr:PREDICTED: protein fem-1 homolog C-like [Amphimedon queenslandica]|eukprot:XP_011402513.1 PREDICTED: protein fem-1 homolog C-like [Amphimedon queenslandica]
MASLLEGVKRKKSLSFQFSKENYESLCTHAQDGDMSKLVSLISLYDSTSFGSATFCPDPKQHKPSPFVLAAQYGRLETVSYFLDSFGHIIDIDHGATIISRTTRKQVHHATALWAACTGGHIDIVRLLVSKGANVNKTTLTRSTPLRGASFHGFIDVMRYLIKVGADINTPNCIGQSPLCIAAMRGEVEAVRFLVQNGADTSQHTINGYSVMHLAAAKGKDEVISYLLEVGVSPGFHEAKPLEKGYVPCPLFLAASTGQTKAVMVLMKHKDCPLSCQSDANLLLASMQCELRKRLRFTEPKIQMYWEEGLRLREDYSLSPSYLPPLPEYNNRVEIQTLEELQSNWFNPDFCRLDVFYQSLMIRERCMGRLDQGLIYFLIRRGSYFCHDRRYIEAEQLWERAMSMEIEVCNYEISHGEYGHCEGIMRDLEKDLTVYSEGICTMLQAGYEPNFTQYINYGLKELEILQQLGEKADCEVIDCTTLLGLIMEIFLSWITLSSYENDKGAYSWPKECDALGRGFVSKYLHYAPGTTLLHLSLTNFNISDQENRKILDRYVDLRGLILALLAWGADDVLDMPNSEGKRPLHVALDLSVESGDIEVLSPLIDSGPHLDAVDSNGVTVYEAATMDIHKVLLYSHGPSPLTCCAARVIVKTGIDYSGLPSHIRKFIRIHDKEFVMESFAH